MQTVFLRHSFGDLSLLVDLRAGDGTPYSYSGTDPNVRFQVMAADDPTLGAVPFTLTDVGVPAGLHVLTISSANILQGLSSFVLSHDLDSFEAVTIVVYSDPNTESALSSQLGAVESSLTSTINTAKASIETLVQTILEVTEYNTKTDFEYDPNTGEVSKMTISYVGSDSSPNFDSPNKKFELTFTRDGNGKVVSVTRKEVVV